MNTSTSRLAGILLVAVITAFTAACGGVPGNDRIGSQADMASNSAVKDVPAPSKDVFAGADGVVQFVEGVPGADRTLTIYDPEGAPLKRIDRDDDSFGSLEGESGDFFPLLFSNGAKRDFAIEMRALRKSRHWIEVVVHETREPRATGFVRADDPQFRFIEWPEWVLGHFNIRFDADENPVVDAPGGTPRFVEFPDEPLIKPDTVEGDWVRIRWVRHESREPTVGEIARYYPGNEGWIRWRKDGKVLIGEYFP